MSESKRMKFDIKGKHKKNYYANQNTRKREFMEVGQRGFLVTCNFREKDCVRDSYRLLNQCADEMYGKQDEAKALAKDDDEAEEVDISVQLQKEAESLKSEQKNYRFQVVDSGATNCIFIKTQLDPVEMAVAIVKDIAETKKQKSRYILRFIPIEVTCKANIKDIKNAAGPIFDKHFLKEGKTFGITFNKRYNNDVSRDEIIKELADMISLKNIKNKVDLKNPELSVIVEVVKGLCCISVIPDYFKYKKYNLTELCSQNTNESKAKDSEVQQKDEETKTSDTLPLNDGISDAEPKTQDDLPPSKPELAKKDNKEKEQDEDISEKMDEGQGTDSTNVAAETLQQEET